MGITITARWKILHPELRNGSRFRTKIGNINDHEFFCHFRIKEGKNKMGAAKARINYFYIVGKCEFLQLLNDRWSEPIIGKQGVSTPCDYDLWIQH